MSHAAGVLPSLQKEGGGHMEACTGARRTWEESISGWVELGDCASPRPRKLEREEKTHHKGHFHGEAQLSCYGSVVLEHFCSRAH